MFFVPMIGLVFFAYYKWGRSGESENDKTLLNAESEFDFYDDIKYVTVRDQDGEPLTVVESSVDSAATEDGSLTDRSADVYGEEMGTKSYEEEWCILSELTEPTQASASAELDEWRRELGYDPIGTRNRPNSMSYQYYDLPTLHSLADQGDFYAVHQLLERSGVTFDEKRNLAYQALVHGATSTIVPVAVVPNSDLAKLIKSGKPTAAKRLLMEELSWWEYASLRGDYTAFGAAVRSYQKRLEEFGDAVHLSGDDLTAISSMARQHIEAINRARATLGLGAVNLEPPKSAQKMFERKVASILSNGYDLNYGRQFLQTNSCIEKHIEFFTRVRKSREARLAASSE